MLFVQTTAGSNLRKALKAISKNNMASSTARPILYGVIASLILLGLYFMVLSFVSGWSFAKEQFFSFWYFIVLLAGGFGVQIGLYSYLRSRIKQGRVSGKLLGITGTTSTAAMIACCTHYLTNLLPIIGTVGIVTFVAHYQVELFCVGLAFNLGGILYIASRIMKFARA